MANLNKGLSFVEPFDTTRTGPAGFVMYNVDENGVATIIMNRPSAMNAMDEGIMQGTSAAIAMAADDPNVKCVILTGAGRGFCAGGDVKGMASGGNTSGNGEPSKPMPLEGGIWQLRTNMYSSELLRKMGKPTIAAINGACAGAGFSWACACDLRYAVTGAKFTTAFINVGLSGDFGGTWTLPRIVGPAKARELYLTADIFKSEEALEMGLVSAVLPDRDSLMAHVTEIATKIAKRAPTAMRRIKANLNDADRLSFPEQLGVEAERHTRSGVSPEARIAAVAFTSKKDPDFSVVADKTSKKKWDISRL